MTQNRFKKLSFLCLTLCAAAVFADTPREISARLMKNYRAMRERKILVSPIPKHLEFISTPVHTGSMILVADTGNELAALAAGIINSRLSELGENKLPISAKPQAGKYNIIIDTGFAPINGKPQSYSLSPVKNGIYLRGADRSGVLYAAVTSRYLFGKQDNKTVFHAAAVRDWPDIPLRQANLSERAFYREFERDYPQRYLNSAKPWMNQLLHHKINVSGQHTYTPFQDAFSPFRKTPDLPPAYVKRIRELNDRLSKLDIRTSMIMSMRLATKKQNGDLPEVRNLTFIPWHNLYFSWGYPELQTIAAKKLLNYAKNAGIRELTLHPVDSGSIPDPEMWSTRDEASRKRYPLDTDRAKADADLVAIYEQVFKGSGIKLAFIPYPYFPKSFTRDGVASQLYLDKNSPETEKYLKRIIDWAKELDSRLSPEIAVEYREDITPAVREYAKIFSKRQKKVYFESNVFRFQQDDHPLLSPYLATMATFAPPYSGHVFRAHGANCYEPLLPITAEYMWNVYAPFYSEYMYQIKHDPGRLPFMAEYTCVAAWGPEIGPLAAKAFDSGLSLQYLLKPEEIERARGIKDPLTAYGKAWKDLEKAVKAFDAARKKLDSCGGFHKLAVASPGPESFNQYHLIFYGARIHAAARIGKLMMMKAIRQGKLKEASDIAKSTLNKLDIYKKEFDKLNNSISEKEVLFKPDKVGRITDIFKKAVSPDVKKAAEEIMRLDREKSNLFAAGNVPGWMKNHLKKPVYVSMVKNNTVKIDGELNDTGWKNAVPAEHFLRYGVLQLADFPISARFCRDGKFFYVSGIIKRKGLKNYKEVKTFGGESFQMFFPASGGKTLQYMIFPGGTLIANKGASSSGRIGGIRQMKTAAVCKTAVSDEQWQFELAIPIAELGSVPDKLLASYERKPEKDEHDGQFYSISFVSGGPFFDQAHHRKIYELKWKQTVDPELSVYLAKAPEIQEVLTASGTGTNVTFSTVLESKRPLFQVKISAELFNENGKLAGKTDVADTPYITALYTAEQRAVTTGSIYRNMLLKLTVEYILDGKKSKQSFIFPLGSIKAEMLKKFINSGNDIEISSYLPCKMDLQKGEICMDFLPLRHKLNTQYLFQAGKSIIHNPAISNNNSVHAYLFGNDLFFEIYDRKYKRHAVMTQIKNGRWNSCKFNWQAKDGVLSLSMTVNGKTVSREYNSKPFKGNRPPLQLTGCDYLQFNSINNSYAPGFFALKNISVNGGSIDPNRLFSGSAQYPGNVYPAAKKMEK